MSKVILDEQNKRKETLMNDERREYIRDQLYAGLDRHALCSARQHFLSQYNAHISCT